MTASGCILSHSPKKPATTASTIGQTGTGKSTLLENMLYQDCESGAGFAVMEPNPDLTHRVLNHISKQRAETVVHIDLADSHTPYPSTPLRILGEEHRDLRHLVCSNIMAAFRKIWADQWSSTRMARVLRHTILALWKPREATCFRFNSC